jgi:hypothetical protein
VISYGGESTENSTKTVNVIASDQYRARGLYHIMTKESSSESVKDSNTAKTAPKESSPAMSSSSPNGSGNMEEKPRLSEHEKKANHIASGMYSSNCLPC